MVKTVLLALFLTSLSSLSSLAAVDERLPDSSIYKGEIRRGPDGRLMSIESAELPGAALKAASMIVGPQEKITSISEVLGMEGDVIVTQEIFLYDFGDGRSPGRFRPTGIKPHCCDKLAAGGAGVKDEWFS